MARKAVLLSMMIVSFGLALGPVDYDRRICRVLKTNWGWSRSLKKVSKRYDISPGLLLSIIYHESGFKPYARPKRDKLLGVIPWQMKTSFGYGQIKDETWKWYQGHNPGWFQSRTNFSDTLHFIGWYYQLFLTKAQSDLIQRDFYLAYHEGLGGYSRGSYDGNEWLLNKANSVVLRAEMYNEALKDCL